MERIFNAKNDTYSILGTIDSEGLDDYDYTIKALIADTIDHEESDLQAVREQNLRYYEGLEPALSSEDAEAFTPAEAIGDEPQSNSDSRSTVVSTDVRDTILSILPSLMRIFANDEHAVEYVPRTSDQVKFAEQATDYIRYKIWEENDGFLMLYDAFWDALVTAVGVVTWGTETSRKVLEKTFSSLTVEDIGRILSEAAEQMPEVVSHDPPIVGPDGNQYYPNVRIRYTESNPFTWVEGVPPENFRISRGAKSAKTAPCIGYEEIIRVSDLVEEGFDYDEISQYVGDAYRYTPDQELRHPGSINYPLNDLVNHGRWFIRIDSDGDGVNELHEIRTVGNNYEVIYDQVIDEVPMALFTSDRRPHSAVGRAFASLILDIQRVKTNMQRGHLDSLAQAIFPRTAVNELLTNMEDVMSDDVGAPIRTRAPVSEAVAFHTTPYLGDQIINALNYMDNVRYQRSGVNDASKGLDPKAFQSTNLQGIDAIVAGSQERIEMIAMLFAHTGMKDLYNGLLKEVTRNPNKSAVMKLRGEWVPVDPSLFDPDMQVAVNPHLGKGTDQTRMMMLQGIAAAQMQVVEKFGLGNGVVGVNEMRNTQVDIMSLGNIKSHTRYFREIDPKMAQQMETAPKDPDAATLLAQAQLEKVKSDTVKAIRQTNLDDKRMQLEDDFRRDQLNVNTFIDLLTLQQEGALGAADLQLQVEEMNQPEEPSETVSP